MQKCCLSRRCSRNGLPLDARRGSRRWTTRALDARRGNRTQAVSPGVSWGSLPLDLQATWRDYDCDIFVQDAVEGMLADADSHEERVQQLAERREERAAAGQDDLIEPDDFVGDIKSTD